ncbi:MAG: hypothetical protein IV086_17235 [Hyphomonadaceae bacterium]|nr:MAG: hypothetical protein FD160_1206 [Caulobacteraceae bacterium]MBT9447448.1 hypothetical protein [Hyphomonadaceae bacterium]TPW08768.1 MAG: hypothetical protein FD124_154 [Alphaproteobacteria bacterium]
MSAKPLVAAEGAPGLDVFECARAFLGIARELANASGVCIGLEGSVTHLLTHYTGEDRSVLIRELQHLDVLNQLLVSLSSYASVLGSQCIAGVPLDIDGASQELGLARVAARLRELEDRDSADRVSDSGEMDLL